MLFVPLFNITHLAHLPSTYCTNCHHRPFYNYNFALLPAFLPACLLASLPYCFAAWHEQRAPNFLCLAKIHVVSQLSTTVTYATNATLTYAAHIIIRTIKWCLWKIKRKCVEHFMKSATQFMLLSKLHRVTWWSYAAKWVRCTRFTLHYVNNWTFQCHSQEVYSAHLGGLTAF